MSMATFKYKVQQSDKPETIAKRFNLTTDQLVAANKGSTFKLGEGIRVPRLNAAPPPAPQPSYLDEQIGQWLKGLPSLGQLNTALSAWSQPGRGFYRPPSTANQNGGQGNVPYGPP